VNFRNWAQREKYLAYQFQAEKGQSWTGVAVHSVEKSWDNYAKRVFVLCDLSNEECFGLGALFIIFCLVFVR